MDSPVQVFTEISYQGTDRDDNERQNRYITGYDIVEPQSPDECFEAGESKSDSAGHINIVSSVNYC